MIKQVLIMSALLLSFNNAYAAKTKHKKSAPKMSKEEAKELCLTSKGASISKKDLKKCVSRTMRTGKI